MLSYQHGYHAGNLADVHKHALLAWVLDYMATKDKPMSYIETHAGSGFYRLDTEAARKTGEAAAGIGRLEQAFDPGHPYRRAIDMVRAAHGIASYPGSPLIAAHLLRHADRMTLAELHPQEYEALSALLRSRATIHRRDGLEMALALCPPMPRRGVLVCDPSYEVKDEYHTVPRALAQIRRKWNVGVLLLWYPILTSEAHAPMIARLRADHSEIAVFEARFPPIRPGHRMTGSGLVVINPPWGMAEEAARVAGLIRQITA
ncbi:MAG: 23S rRNA (adenine(2030)-N(6))-methyltransferase RlmJ [Rhodobacteraceae bacterium]|nr:MAG: 23S rRNA (adenine(2030)-N(6))-methyltransferase RlmJ [Paracoccaceae bacterium]